MALTKAKKEQIVEEVAELLKSSKLTVAASYDGTSVKQMQELRKNAKESGTKVKVIKNRLVKQALASQETYKDADVSQLNKQLLYAFNDSDEVAPAKSLADFAKKNPSIVFIGAYTHEGQFMSAEEVKSLASLPSKPEIIASVLATLSSPVNETISALSGNLHGLLDGMTAKATN